MDTKKLTAIVFIIIVYIVTTVGSYAVFSKAPIGKKNTITPVASSKNGDKVMFDDNLPKTEACPLNGVLYSTQQKEWWEQHRPLGVMIENHPEARPQSGLSSADVIYEAVAEGGITRYLVLFYCQDGGRIGPVRSARTYFVDFVSEYGDYPLYAHVGGANSEGPANALGQINDYGWFLYNDMNQISNGDLGYPIFLRDTLGNPNIATEHTMYSWTAKLWGIAKDRGLTNVDKEGNKWDDNFKSYTFKEDASNRPTSQSIHLEFWKDYKEFFIDWTYDKSSNQYKRNTGVTPHIDRNTKKQLVSKNIVVLSMIESNANDGYENNLHLLYKTKGTGKATIFTDGEKITGTWRKDKRTARTLLFDSNGEPIKFNRGLIWFEILPIDGVLTVK